MIQILTMTCFFGFKSDPLKLLVVEMVEDINGFDFLNILLSSGRLSSEDPLARYS